jgi:hypothetical protein
VRPGDPLFPGIPSLERDVVHARRSRLPLRNDCRLVTKGETNKAAARQFPQRCCGLKWPRRQDLTLRPLGPEPATGVVATVGGLVRPSQPLDDTGVEATAAVEGLPQNPQNPLNGEVGNASAEQVAADLRRTEFLRPECLLPVSAVADRLGVSVSTVHEAFNAGRLRCILFGSVRRDRPEDLEAYVRSRAPPAHRPTKTGARYWT